MNKLSAHFLFYTFAIMLICWGTCWACSDRGFYMQENMFLYPLYMLGGWSPTIASYLVLKRFGHVNGLKQWLGNVFGFRCSVRSYIMVFVLAALFILPQCLICGYEKGAPLFAIVFMVPVMLFGGGLEEAGWRYVLQPEMEKKFGFFPATMIMSVIWWLWHLPLFYIQGVSQYGADYITFGVNIVGLSFALAAIRRCTKSVWLCVLFHCVTNSLSGIYIVKENILGNILSMLVLVILSCLLVRQENAMAG